MQSGRLRHLGWRNSIIEVSAQALKVAENFNTRTSVDFDQLTCRSVPFSLKRPRHRD